jgi:superfamily II DNA or RNA helicase
LILRPYQTKLSGEIHAAWQYHQNVLAVLPTGGGKTVLFSNIIQKHIGASCVIVHRQELVGQISLALAKCGVRHKIIAPNKVIKWIVQSHMEELGNSFYDPGSSCAVAGVDTLLNRKDELAGWFNKVTLWVIDEAHHLLVNNKWGRAVALFPNAKGLGVTATPCRADGNGLGRHADGVMDVIVEGPTQKELIDAGYLTNFKIFAPPCDLDISDVPITASGDLSKPKLKLQIRKSRIVGDVVEHYLKFAAGKLGATFATDIGTASDIARAYNAAGVPAEVISSKTPINVRVETMRRFRRREILQLVTVDIIGEGVDIPALEVISMARPTESFGLFVQYLGRVLRILEGKDIALVIDHVGNVTRHARIEDDEYGRPYISFNREWTLDRRERRTKKERDADLVATRICKACTAEYVAYFKSCPYCGEVDIPAERSAPEFVDGDLTELSAEALAALQGDVDRVDLPEEIVRRNMERGNAPGIAVGGAVKQHRKRQEAQAVLREAIAWWAGHQDAAGRPRSESYRRFYHTFGMDVLSAQALGRPAAEALTERVNKTIGRTV